MNLALASYTMLSGSSNDSSVASCAASYAQCAGAEISQQSPNPRPMQVRVTENATAARANTPFQEIDPPTALVAVR